MRIRTYEEARKGYKPQPEPETQATQQRREPPQGNTNETLKELCDAIAAQLRAREAGEGRNKVLQLPIRTQENYDATPQLKYEWGSPARATDQDTTNIRLLYPQVARALR